MEPIIKISPGASKWDIREKVWSYIEEKNLANFPRPVYNRIPNFKGAVQTCNKLTELEEFKSSQTVKVNPDKPQLQARVVTLNANKTLLVPTPRLRTGLFNKITPPQGATKVQMRLCASSQGVKIFSVPIGLDTKMKVDLVVVGSVAVSEKGCRIGKGEGFADMEYAMMVSIGAVTESTLVVTIVHDCQVMDIPEELMESHDLTVDVILTPTRVITTNCKLPKPQGIIWSKLTAEKLERIPILKKLRTLEEHAGKDVTLGTSASVPQPERPKREIRRRPQQNAQTYAEGEVGQEVRQEKKVEAERKSRPARFRKNSRGDGRREKEGENSNGIKEKKREGVKEQEPGEVCEDLTSQRKVPLRVTTLYLGGIPSGLRVSELKSVLREIKVAPLRLTWQGAQHRAFLDYTDPQSADAALEALQGLSLNGQNVQVEMAKSQRGGKKYLLSGRRPKPAYVTKSKAAPAEPKSETAKEPE